MHCCNRTLSSSCDRRLFRGCAAPPTSISGNSSEPKERHRSLTAMMAAYNRNSDRTVSSCEVQSAGRGLKSGKGAPCCCTEIDTAMVLLR